jgi:hypothetical protein
MMIDAQRSIGATPETTQNISLRITTLSGSTSGCVREGSHEVETMQEATVQITRSLRGRATQTRDAFLNFRNEDLSRDDGSRRRWAGRDGVGDEVLTFRRHDGICSGLFSQHEICSARYFFRPQGRCTPQRGCSRRVERAARVDSTAGRGCCANDGSDKHWTPRTPDSTLWASPW